MEQPQLALERVQRDTIGKTSLVNEVALSRSLSVPQYPLKHCNNGRHTPGQI